MNLLHTPYLSCELIFSSVVGLESLCEGNDAWAVGLQHSDGWSVVYSGDTRPCANVVRLGNQMRPGCRILIHEATFDDSAPMRQEAEQKRHSTVNEALDVGIGMHAWRVVLTHFSQRYPKLTDVRHTHRSTTRRSGEDSALVAFDQMTIPFHLLPDLPQLTTALLCLFAVRCKVLMRVAAKCLPNIWLDAASLSLLARSQHEIRNQDEAAWAAVETHGARGVAQIGGKPLSWSQGSVRGGGKGGSGKGRAGRDGDGKGGNGKGSGGKGRGRKGGGAKGGNGGGYGRGRRGGWSDAKAT